MFLCNYSVGDSNRDFDFIPYFGDFGFRSQMEPFFKVKNKPQTK